MEQMHAEALVERLFAAYPAVALREETREIFVSFVGELGEEQAKAAIDDLIRSAAELPTIALIRRRIAERLLDLPSPVEAYSSIFGSDPRHPLTRYVADIFGGEYNIRTSELPAAIRSQFLRYFEEIRDEAVRRGSLPQNVVQANEAREAPYEGPEPVGIWAAIKTRFVELPDDERSKRLKLARRELMRRGEVSADYIVRPLVEHEAMKTFAEENGWLQEAS